MKKLVLLAALASAGCVQNDVEMRSKPPRAQFSSALPVDRAVSCLTTSLSQNYHSAYGRIDQFHAEVLSPGQEYDVVSAAHLVDGRYIFVVNVKASGAGSLISIYERMGALPYLRESMDAAIASCL